MTIPAIRKVQNKTARSVKGKLVEALVKIQILVARNDVEAIWHAAEQAIELGTERH